MNKIKKISIFLIGFLLIFTSYTFAKTGTTDAPNGLVLREEASKSSNPILTVSDKEEVEILEETGEWYKVKYGEYEGYLFAEYVTVKEEPTTTVEPTETEKPEETPANPEEPSDTMTVGISEPVYPQNVTASSDLKVYVIPSITATVENNIATGTVVTIQRSLNNWLYITTDSVQGWVREYPLKNVITVTTPDVENQETNEQPETTQNETETSKPEETPVNTTPSITEGYISVDAANVREEANTESAIVTTLTLNTKVSILAETDEWYKIEFDTYKGYIAKRLISETAIATSRSTTEEREGTSQIVGTGTATATGNAIVDFAMQYKGKGYVYGGTSPETGFDCTGFTYYIYTSCGYNISRSCSGQTNAGREVAKSELQPGDLLLFDNTSDGSIGHVGIYIGDGNFIHAANPRRGVVVDTILRDYYYTYYYSARRIAE